MGFDSVSLKYFHKVPSLKDCWIGLQKLWRQNMTSTKERNNLPEHRRFLLPVALLCCQILLFQRTGKHYFKCYAREKDGERLKG